MNLSNDLISQFVKITNDDHRKQENTKAYGKVVTYNGQNYVQLDGSDLLTPVDTTVKVQDEERVTVTIKDHNVTIDGNIDDVSASNREVMELSNEFVTFKVDTEGIFMEVTNEIGNLNTKIDITANGIRAEVTEKVNGLSSKIDVTANEIRTEVSKKVDAGQVGTIVTQNAESWKLSINGKLYGTNYTFDGTNFTIGTTNGNDKACHGPTYSRWNHSDGSYTQVDSSGIRRYVSGGNKYYHYLQYAGEYICNSEQQVGITLPSEFKGKNFQVITAVKRIYVALLDYIEYARFPLLSFYAEARNINHSAGYFEIYASIRAWNRTGVSGMGTVVGTNDTANETAAVKPVVAYWVYA